MFDRWKSPVIPSPGKGIPPIPPPRALKKGSQDCLVLQSEAVRSYPHLIRTNSLPSPKKRNGDIDKSLNAWSEGLLAEFNSIIAQELTSLLNDAEDGVFLTSDDEGHVTPTRSKMTRSKSLDHQVESSSGSPSASDTSSSSAGSDRPLHRFNQRLKQDKGAPVLLKVTPLPDQDSLRRSPCSDEKDGRGHTPDEGLGCCDSGDSINIQVSLLNTSNVSYTTLKFFKNPILGFITSIRFN